MEGTRRRMARNLIVWGYSVIFVGTMIDIVWQISSQIFQQSWRADVNIFSTLFASFTAIVAWWFLSRIIAEKPDQLSLIRKAYLGLALQALLLSTNIWIYLATYRSISWVTASTWGYGIGTVATAAGFFVMALSYPPSMATSDGTVSAEQ
ncbi:MAG TPA: hypothetical protein VNF05_01430 [Acidimicrobiales bacterium]|nr:hypothetical protein [Acidimicrobiales bacterium]